MSHGGRTQTQNMMKQIEVVAAIIHNSEGRVFATQRGYGEWKDYWEFPGGKMELGESPEEALRREIWEELETKIVVEKYDTTVEYDYPNFHLIMHCYWCRVEIGCLKLKEHESALWLKPDELDNQNWLPADMEMIAKISRKPNGLKPRYANRGHRWTKEDVDLLWNLFNNKVTIDELAMIFGRSRSAISFQLEKAAHDRRVVTIESIKNEHNKVFGVKDEHSDHEKWQWQEPGTTWKGVGLYHITLTIPDRQALLGSLVIPEKDPSKAIVIRTALGNALVNCLLSISSCHPGVQVLHFCLMPDHLHAVLYVRRPMSNGIGSLVRGFWQAAKKLGRAWSATSFATSSSIPPNGIREQYQEVDAQKKILREETRQLEDVAAALREQMGDEAYYRLMPVFTEMPFIRPMWRRVQLPNTIRYIDMNPQRLATKRLKPGLFRVQREIEIGGRTYDGVGNTTLLMSNQFEVVHVRRKMVEEAKNGNESPLRDYMNSCVLKARKGTVMVSPFISSHEKQVMQVLLREKLSFILLTNNGFSDYYKPTDTLFDACASGKVLILSPWPYDAAKRHINREECMALNRMAEEITSL